MPDPQRLEELHAAAVVSIGVEITACFQGSSLTGQQLAEYRGRAIKAGWRLPVAFDDRERRLDLLIPPTVPFGIPKVALVDRPPELTWPHMEQDGVLCLDDGSTTVDFRDPVGVALEVLRDGDKHVQESIAGKNQQHFLDEFHSYWRQAKGPRGKGLLSLVDPVAPTRVIHAWRGQGFVVLADDISQVLRWLDNRYGKPKKEWTTVPAVFFWLEKPLSPVEYPDTAADVARLLAQGAPGSLLPIEELAQTAPDQITVLIGAPSRNGPCLAGITIRPPVTIRFEGSARRPRLQGFRPGHTPAALFASTYLQAPTPVIKSDVSRIDANWIHGRGQDPRHGILAAATVVIAGCGSVGGHVGVLLAQAGVGRLILIDPQNLEWANIGRHPLGAKWVGLPKASSLASQLRENYPHLLIDAHDKGWEDVAASDSSVLMGASVIANATGSWMSNAAMNSWQRSLPAPPILYGWTEAHACAGHAVAIGHHGACLECGFDRFGRPAMPVTEWPPGGTEKQEPACGAKYQPYGPVELMNVVQLIAGAALDVLTDKYGVGTHWVYIGRDSFVKDCGGEWNRAWASVPGWRSEGGCSIMREWPVRPDCLGGH